MTFSDTMTQRHTSMLCAEQRDGTAIKEDFQVLANSAVVEIVLARNFCILRRGFGAGLPSCAFALSQFILVSRGKALQYRASRGSGWMSLDIVGRRWMAHLCHGAATKLLRLPRCGLFLRGIGHRCASLCIIACQCAWSRSRNIAWRG